MTVFTALASTLQGDFCNEYQYHTWPVLWILYILWIYCMTHYIVLCLTSALDTVHPLDLLYDTLYYTMLDQCSGYCPSFGLIV